ncbi:MAG TPA: hypothetical protein ENJ10_14480 [Caldithrix abyssi]|uniref:Cytochrome C oxidase subunit IV n=1 Tax=Caldithrix abyssi TaxID=187145 RepID=A0A7V1PVK2_CALAY|nr:hypothetical protein [Caldithrix abyssi]
MLNNKTGWLLLILFTLAGSWLSGLSHAFLALVMILFALKFFIISYQYMGLRFAHPFWRYSINIVVLGFVSVIIFSLL